MDKQLTERIEARNDRAWLKIERQRVEVETLKAVINNPVIELVLLYLAIEYLQKRGVIPPLAGSVAEGAGIATISLQQIAPAFPYLADLAKGTVGDIIKAGASAGPLIGTALALPK